MQRNLARTLVQLNDGRAPTVSLCAQLKYDLERELPSFLTNEGNPQAYWDVIARMGEVLCSVIEVSWVGACPSCGVAFVSPSKSMFFSLPVPMPHGGQLREALDTVMGETRRVAFGVCCDDRCEVMSEFIIATASYTVFGDCVVLAISPSDRNDATCDNHLSAIDIPLELTILSSMWQVVAVIRKERLHYKADVVHAGRIVTMDDNAQAVCASRFPHRSCCVGMRS